MTWREGEVPESWAATLAVEEEEAGTVLGTWRGTDVDEEEEEDEQTAGAHEAVGGEVEVEEVEVVGAPVVEGDEHSAESGAGMSFG